MMHAETILSPKNLSQVWIDLAQDDGTPDSYELTEHGEIVMSPKPSNGHQVICAKFLVQLWTQLGKKAVPDSRRHH